MVHFLSKHCFCFLEQVILQCFHILFALILPSQEARLPTFLAGAVLEQIHDGGGVSGLELPSKICEVKCYKPNLFSNYKPIAFQK